jgi:hypothetical protein
MYFVELQERLIAAARQRIRTGLVTERRLAILSGISQPHMHNVLSGIRSVTFNSADKMLRGLGLTIPDLLGQTKRDSEAATRIVPVLRAPIGPGRDAGFSVYGGHFPVPAELVREAVNPVLARLGPDLALPRAFVAGDLVLLDQNPVLRTPPGTAGYWVMADGGGLRIGYLPTENERSTEPRGRRIEALLKARVIWMAREITQNQITPDPDKPRGPRAPSSPS